MDRETVAVLLHGDEQCRQPDVPQSDGQTDTMKSLVSKTWTKFIQLHRAAAGAHVDIFLKVWLEIPGLDLHQNSNFFGSRSTCSLEWICAKYLKPRDRPLSIFEKHDNSRGATSMTVAVSWIHVLISIM